MTDAMLTITGLTAIAHSVGVTDAQARALMEYAGVKVQPEKPALPTDPESIITATEVREVTGKWRMMLDLDGEWFSTEEICGNLHHLPEHITVWTEAMVVPAGKQIDPDDVREDNRVRLEFTDGDVWEIRVSATHKESFFTTTDLHIYHKDIRTIHLLNREGEA